MKPPSHAALLCIVKCLPHHLPGHFNTLKAYGLFELHVYWILSIFLCNSRGKVQRKVKQHPAPTRTSCPCAFSAPRTSHSQVGTAGRHILGRRANSPASVGPQPTYFFERSSKQKKIFLTIKFQNRRVRNGKRPGFLHLISDERKKGGEEKGEVEAALSKQLGMLTVYFSSGTKRLLNQALRQCGPNKWFLDISQYFSSPKARTSHDIWTF